MKHFFIILVFSISAIPVFAQFPASSKIYCFKEVAKEVVDSGVREQINNSMYYFAMFGDNGKLAISFDSRNGFLENIKKDNDYYWKILTKQLDEFDSKKAKRESLLGKTVDFYSDTPMSAVSIWGNGNGSDFSITCYARSYSNPNQVAYRTSYLHYTESISSIKDVNKMFSKYPGKRYYDDEITYYPAYIFNRSRSQMVILYEKKDSSDVRIYLEEIDMNLLLPEKKSYEVF